MGQYSKVKILEARIRASKPYDDWVIRHKAAFCLRCSSRDMLECHHVIELYHVVLGLWKLYGDEDMVFQHTLAMHSEDMCESATLCDECHKKLHPARQAQPAGDTRTEEWSAVPRNITFRLAHSTRDSRPDALGLIAVQTLFAIGWYILNGKMDSRMLELNRRKLAKVIGKTPSTSFNKSLDRTLKSLESVGILLASHRAGNDIELHLSPDYLKTLTDNPWFVPMSDVRTSRMCILALKWFLGQQSRRKCYKIGMDKLCRHLGITTTHMPMAAKAVKEACEKIKWADLEIESGMCTFSLKRRGSVPIFSLRQVLADSVDYDH
jgi:hypothetical protein